MLAFTLLTKNIGRLIRPCAMSPYSAQLCSARNFVYHRSSKVPRSSLTDYDDGYHYRNGEEQYAQTLRNKQEVTLRFDDLFYKYSKKKRPQHHTSVDFPNCNCLEGLKELEKRKANKPRPQTACALHEYAASYYDM